VRYLITGGCGFLGSNLASEVLKRGEELFIIDNLSRKGSENNFNWLESQGDLKLFNVDIRDTENVMLTVSKTSPDIIFHLAGQVAMTTSVNNPRYDFEINTLGTINVLEAVRLHVPECIVIYSSTNKVYGDLEWVNFKDTETRYIADGYPKGFDENIPFDPHSPYGCSKGAADKYMTDYARIFNIKTIVFRHSSMYGTRQYSTYDQGWIGWFCEQALDTKNGKLIEPFTISGNGKQVRDVLHSEDMKSLYFAAINHINQAKGQVFNIGGGVSNSLSLLELFNYLNKKLNINLKYSSIPKRDSDQKIFIADISKAKALLNWKPNVDFKTGISSILNWNRDK